MLANLNSAATIKATTPAEQTTDHSQTTNKELTTMTSAYTSLPDSTVTVSTSAPSPCEPNPCQNNGTCIDSGSLYICHCELGFSGDHCEVTPCSSNPCQNGGSCSINGGSYNCACPDGYSGNECQITPCSPNPCQNGGSCTITGESYDCTCVDDFFGDTCELQPEIEVPEGIGAEGLLFEAYDNSNIVLGKNGSAFNAIYNEAEQGFYITYNGTNGVFYWGSSEQSTGLYFTTIPYATIYEFHRVLDDSARICENGNPTKCLGAELVEGSPLKFVDINDATYNTIWSYNFEGGSGEYLSNSVNDTGLPFFQ